MSHPGCGRRWRLAAGIALALAIVGGPERAAAQWATTYDQFYLPGSFNWQFRKNYAAADRLFNGFDFGHAILYETLWRNPGGAVRELEETWYDRLTRDILLDPPRVPLEEAAIEIAYAKLVPEAKQMLDFVAETARKAGLDEYRLMIFCGPGAGQTVFHLHWHVLGGRVHGMPR